MGRDTKLKRLVEEACRIHDMYSVLGLDGRSNKIVCPIPEHVHHNYSPSFNIFSGRDGQKFWCHGNCGRTGDVVDLVGYLHIPGYDQHNPENVQRALALLDDRYEIAIPQPPPKKATLHPARYKRYLPPRTEVIEYAARRGLNEDTLSKFNVGQFKLFMSMPVFEEGICVAIKFRNTQEGDRFWAAKGSRKALFNHDAVAYVAQPILIVKGEIPVMLLSQFGILACAPTGGEAADVAFYNHILAVSPKRVVVGDNDPGDVGERTKMQAQDRANSLLADLRFPPRQYKDIDDWILAEANAIEAIRSWMEV